MSDIEIVSKIEPSTTSTAKKVLTAMASSDLQRKNYSLTPVSRKSAWEVEKYSKTFEDGRTAKFVITSCYKDCTIISSLTQEEVNEIEDSGEYSSNKYDCDVQSLGDEWYQEYEIEINPEFTSQELQDIKKELFKPLEKDDEESTDSNYYDIDDLYMKLTRSGWKEENIEYGIDNGVEISPYDEDSEDESKGDEDDEECLKNYSVEPENRKSVIQIETYAKMIPDKGIAIYKITTYFRDCSLNANLTKDDVKQIRKSGEFSTMSYDSDFECGWDSWDIHYEMVKISNFTQEELNNIENNLENIFKDDEDDYEEYHDIYDKLQKDGWDIEDTEYIIENGVILTEN